MGKIRHLDGTSSEREALNNAARAAITIWKQLKDRPTVADLCWPGEPTPWMRSLESR